MDWTTFDFTGINISLVSLFTGFVSAGVGLSLVGLFISIDILIKFIRKNNLW